MNKQPSDYNSHLYPNVTVMCTIILPAKVLMDFNETLWMYRALKVCLGGSPGSATKLAEIGHSL